MSISSNQCSSLPHKIVCSCNTKSVKKIILYIDNCRTITGFRIFSNWSIIPTRYELELTAPKLDIYRACDPWHPYTPLSSEISCIVSSEMMRILLILIACVFKISAKNFTRCELVRELGKQDFPSYNIKDCKYTVKLKTKLKHLWPLICKIPGTT